MSSAVDSVVLDHSESAVGIVGLIVGLVLGVRIITPSGSFGVCTASFLANS
jgi:hypothetical protein